MTRGRNLRFAAAGILVAFATSAPALPQAGRELSVGVYEAPPWSMKDASGQWKGLTVDLWKELAADLDLRYRFVDEAPDAILDAVAAGRMDTAAGPFARTLDREQEIDFTHSYAASDVGIAVLRAREADRWLQVLEALSTPTALKLYAAVVALTFLAGVALWLLERQRNAMFSGTRLQGMGSGFWWAGVTTVGVGYGDKVPITFWGRLVALSWMFASLILVTALTAFVTAKLALAEVGRIQGPAGLRHSVVGTVEGSAATDLLRREAITHRVYPGASQAVDALLSGEVDALVYGSAILRYYAGRDPSRRLDVLPGSLEALDFAFPLPDKSPLRDPLNDALRHVLMETHWQDLKDRYLVGDPRAAGAPR